MLGLLALLSVMKVTQVASHAMGSAAALAHGLGGAANELADAALTTTVAGVVATGAFAKELTGSRSRDGMAL